MSTLKIGTITVIVNGFSLNNGSPYFQKAVPATLRQRIGKATIKIPLRSVNGNFAVQCHRLNEKYTALFRAMRDDSSIIPSEAKLAALALLKQAGLEAGDGLQEFKIPLGNGKTDTLNPADFLHDYLSEKDYEPSAVTSAAFSALNNTLPVLLSEAFSVYLDNHQKGKDKNFIASQQQHWDKLINLLCINSLS